MKLYDKRDEFNFPIVYFPFIYSNIPTTHAFGAYISRIVVLITRRVLLVGQELLTLPEHLSSPLVF